MPAVLFYRVHGTAGETVCAGPNNASISSPVSYTLKEAQVLIEAWRRDYNAIRPHGSLGYRPPTLETIIMPSWAPSLAEKPSMH